jgi:hypothetical protein
MSQYPSPYVQRCAIPKSKPAGESCTIGGDRPTHAIGTLLGPLTALLVMPSVALKEPACAAVQVKREPGEPAGREREGLRAVLADSRSPGRGCRRTP